MSKVIGIDLGTTNSVVAVMEGGEPAIIVNQEGGRTTPSVVGFAKEGERLVGQVAKRQSVTNPENTIFSIKRFMGRKHGEISQEIARVPYQVVKTDNGDAWVEVRGKKYSAPEISAMVLQKLKQAAEDYLGDKVTDAVITVPAYFDDAQRQATKDAGRIAGLNVLRIVNEPTAAALAYGMETEGAQRVAVYYLGGEDFDNAIVEHLLAQFSAQNDGMDLRGDRMALQRLKEAAERAKIELSSVVVTEINLPFLAAGTDGQP